MLKEQKLLQYTNNNELEVENLRRGSMELKDLIAEESRLVRTGEMLHQLHHIQVCDNGGVLTKLIKIKYFKHTIQRVIIKVWDFIL